MQDENYWKRFESSGEIDYYLRYKQEKPTGTGAAGETHANNHDGAGAPCNQNGGV